jgi:long-chain acyl-CoA synthetase
VVPDPETTKKWFADKGIEKPDLENAEFKKELIA